MVKPPPGSRSLARSTLEQSALLQTLFTVVLGAIVPNSMFIWDVNGGVNYTGTNSIVAASLATVFGALLLRKISVFPGTSSNLHFILPAFSASYGFAIAAILFLRLDYSNIVLVTSFLATVACQLLVSIFGNRSGMIHFYAVEGGNMPDGMPGLPYTALREPGVPEDRRAVLMADLHHDHDPAWERAFAEAALRDVPVYHYKQVYEAITGRVQIDHLSENSFGSLSPSLAYRGGKRVIDVVACLAALPILLVPMLVVALLIKLGSPGPVLFRQTRMGYRGRHFRVVKFRTMRVTPPDQSDRTSAMTLADDARITPIGRVLRRTRIDELPQIINILRGEMSWIGPRPEAVALSEWYEGDIPFYSYRHIVRPGVTGWAQVNQGHVTDLADVTAKLQYDFFYIKNFSYWIDILITLRTAVVMLNGFGAK